VNVNVGCPLSALPSLAGINNRLLVWGCFYFFSFLISREKRAANFKVQVVTTN
jgi:hypothetical protein